MQKKRFPDYFLTFGRNIRKIGFGSAIKYMVYSFLKKGILVIKPKYYKYPIKLRCGTSDFSIFEQVLSRSGYNIDGMPDSCNIIVDCGANIGLFSLFIRQKYPSAKIIAVEPEKDNYNLLAENTKWFDNIIPLHNGIWYRKCFLQIVNKSSEKHAFQMEESDQQTDIQAISIVDIINEYDLEKIDILKIDIEGSEKIIFENGIDNWLPFVKMLIIELHDRMVPFSSKAVFRALENYNFQIMVKEDNLIFFFEDH